MVSMIDGQLGEKIEKIEIGAFAQNDFNSNALTEKQKTALIKMLRAAGQNLKPVVYRKTADKNKLEIVDGEKVFLAAREAGLSHLNAINVSGLSEPTFPK